MVFTILSLLILLYGFVDFKKGLMAFTIYYLFWYSTPVFSIGGMAMNTTVLVCGGYLVLYVFHYVVNKRKVNPKRFPFGIPFVLIIVSYVASSFTALSGFGTEFARGIRIILLPYAMTWILWKVCYEKSDFEFLFKGITIVMFCACLLGLMEYAVKSNFLLNYKVYLSGDALEIYDSNRLRGYRVSSIFEHPIGGGMTFGLYFAFVITVVSKGNNKIPLKNLAVVTALLCLPCVILSKMRSAMLFTALCSLTLIDFEGLSSKMKKKRICVLLALLFVGLPVLLFLMRDQLYIITSMFSVERVDKVGGSSLSMRLSQLEAVKKIFMKSPLFGLGETFRTYVLKDSAMENALGFESIWFEQLAMHGAVGAVSQLILLLYTVFFIPKKYNSRPAAIFAIAYWCVYTVTSITSFRVIMFFLAEYYLIMVPCRNHISLPFITTNEIYKNAKKRLIRFKW